MNVFARTLADNLKVLNAKERDHLMRFAYLGIGDECGSGVQLPERWLSKAMLAALSPLVPDDAECIFAGMDYHLDWLYAALLFARRGSAVRDHRKARGEMRMQWIDDCPWPQSDSPGVHKLDRTLWPVAGLNEDVDLLVVFANGASTTVLCIEAKGDSTFDKAQMARKVIRLDRILLASGLADDESVSMRYVLCAPKDKLPGADLLDKWKYVLGGRKPQKFVGMESIFEHHRKDRWRPALVPLEGFPDTLSKVTRVDENGKKSATGEYWQIVRRRKRG